MDIEKIKSKKWIDHLRHGSIQIGMKVIIYTNENQEFSLVEIEKIKEFFKNLRS